MERQSEFLKNIFKFLKHILITVILLNVCQNLAREKSLLSGPCCTGQAIDDESHLCELTQINRVAGTLTLNLVPFVPYPIASEQQAGK